VLRAFAILFGLLLMLFCFGTRKADAQIVKSLSKDLLVYNHDTKMLLPFLSNGEKRLPLHLKLPLTQYKGYCLFVKSTENVSIYINNAFLAESGKNVPLYIPVDELMAKARDTTVLLSLWGKYNPLLVDSIAIVSDHLSAKLSSVKKNEEVIRTPARSNTKSVFAILILFGGVLFTAAYTGYPKVFSDFFSLPNLLFNYRVDSNQLRFTFEGHYLTSILLAATFFSFTLGSVFLNLHEGLANYATRNVLAEITKVFFVGLLFYFFKYIIIQFVSWLFSINKYANLHFKVFVEIALVWSVVLIFLALLHFSMAGSSASLAMSSFAAVALFFLTLTSIKTSVLINRATRISTLYLISYLCITEWLLYFVILKLYLNYFS
jgi:hypothetical protein